MLKVENLHFSYGSKIIIKGVSLEVREGETVGLIGPNGSGKTTLLRIITGVLTPKEGRVFVNGVNASRLSKEQLARQIAMVPQNPVIPHTFSTLEVVLMGRTPYLKLLQWEDEKDLKIAFRAMEMTNSQQFASQKVGELSGGERQRVLIARALTQSPSILLLDEPTAHLDISYQVAIFDLLCKLQQSHPLSVLAAVHDLTIAAQYCDRLIMLEGGNIVADGAPQEVLTQERVQRVYGTQVALVRHPQHGTPAVLPVSQVKRNYTSKQS